MAIKHDVATSSLAEVLDRILERGLIIDAYVIVALVGIELLTLQLRVVVASVCTFLRYAKAVGLTKHDGQFEEELA